MNKIKEIISRIKIAFGIVMNGRYIKEYNENSALLLKSEKKLLEACKEFEAIKLRFDDNAPTYCFSNIDTVRLNRIVLPKVPTINHIEEQQNQNETINMRVFELNKIEGTIAFAESINEAYEFACKELARYAYANNLIKITSFKNTLYSASPSDRFYDFAIHFYRG